MKLWNEPTKEEALLYGETKFQKTIKRAIVTLLLIAIWSWFLYELIDLFTGGYF
jgi:hypothetical protein